MTLAALALALPVVVCAGCTIPPALQVVVPEPGQLSLVGPVDVVLGLPLEAEVETLTVTADGADVRPLFPEAQPGVDLALSELWNPAHEPYIPPLDNRIPSNVCDPHGGRPRIGAGVQQMLDFLQPGGLAANTCSGPCDAVGAFEQPSNGVCVPPP